MLPIVARLKWLTGLLSLEHGWRTQLRAEDEVIVIFFIYHKLLGCPIKEHISNLPYLKGT